MFSKNKTSSSINNDSKTLNLFEKMLDKNGDGKLNMNDIIILSLQVPGVKIKRADFLKKELRKKYSEHIINKAILSTPQQANIPHDEIDRIANSVILFERACVSTISAALGTTGGVAMMATIPANIVQYYGYMLRAAQKLLYLYGFPEITTSKNSDKYNPETLNLLALCIGVMYGVTDAQKALKATAQALAAGVKRNLVNESLTKGPIYATVRLVSKNFGNRISKQVFAEYFKNAVPIVGGIFSGTITYWYFKPCCDKLKTTLQNTMLSNPESLVLENQIEKSN